MKEKAMKRFLWAGLAFCLVLASPALSANWQVVSNNECTALNAATVASADSSNATYCCLGVKVGKCLDRQSGGSLFTHRVTFIADGTYTAGGDPVTATELAKIPLDTFADWICKVTTNSGVTIIMFPVVKRTDARKGITVELFTATGTEAAGAIDGRTLDCVFSGT